MGRLVENLWNCKYCGSKGIGGSKRECPHCGSPRDEDIEFYLPGQITYVDEEKAKTINRNPDWVCMYCGCLNSDSNTTCESCGSERTSENLDYFENRKKQESKKVTDKTCGAENVNRVYDEGYNETPYMSDAGSRSEGLEYPTDDAQTNDTFFSRVASRARNGAEGVVEFIKDFWPRILIFIAIIALVVGAIWLFIPKTENVTINNMSWERSIAIEKFTTVDESGWSLPSGARLHETRNEIYTYEQVLDHYENKTRQVAKQRISHYEEHVVGYRDLGNGYSEEITERVPVYETYYETEHYQEPVYRSEPVYKTKYYYEIDKWVYDRSISASAFDKNPYWPDTSSIKSNERDAERKEKYTIWVTTSKGKSKEITMSYNEWSDLMVGDTIKVKVSIFGNGKLA